MRTITCTSLGSVTAISIGSTYEVISESGSRYTIINDRGVQANYGKNLFSAPVEVPQGQQEAAAPAPRRGRPARAEQAAAVGVVNAAPAPRIVSEIGVSTSATLEEDNLSFSIVFDFGNGSTSTSRATDIIESSGINASCGIQSLSGINSLNNFLTTTRESFTRYVNENSRSFTLSPDLNINELFSETTSGIVQDLISSFQGEDADRRAGLLIISTTENAFGGNHSLRTALNTVSASETSVYNPNSGNQIVTWVIPVEEPAGV